MAKPTATRFPVWTWHAVALALALGAGVIIGRATNGDKSSGPGSEKSAAATNSRHSASSLGSRAGRDRTSAPNAARDRAANTSSRHEADSSLAAILEATSRLERTQRLLAFLDRLPVEQFAAVYQEFRDSPVAGLRSSERSLVLQAWAERDPLGALGFLQQNGAGDWERETAVAAWAAKDPQSAFDWAHAAADEGSVNNWLLGAFRGIAATSPELARDFLTRMDQNETRTRALDSLQPYVMQHGFDYATRWLADLADPSLHAAANRMLADDLAALDPVRAGQWNASIADTDTRRDVSETVADRWAAADLASARTWVESLPENTRTEAAEGVARHFARQDPVAAAQWLTGLGNNPDLDGARRIFIEESFRNDPITSLGFVSQLSSPRTREGYYNRLVNGWLHRDTEAARAWVNQNSAILPEGIVRHALR